MPSRCSMDSKALRGCALVILSIFGYADGRCPKRGDQLQLNSWSGTVGAGTGFKPNDVCEFTFKSPAHHGKRFAVLSVTITRTSCVKNLKFTGLEADYCKRKDLPVLIVFMDKCQKPCNDTNNCKRIGRFPVKLTYGDEAVDNGFDFHYRFQRCVHYGKKLGPGVGNFPDDDDEDNNNGDDDEDNGYEDYNNDDDTASVSQPSSITTTTQALQVGAGVSHVTAQPTEAVTNSQSPVSQQVKSATTAKISSNSPTINFATSGHPQVSVKPSDSTDGGDKSTSRQPTRSVSGGKVLTSVQPSKVSTGGNVLVSTQSTDSATLSHVLVSKQPSDSVVNKSDAVSKLPMHSVFGSNTLASKQPGNRSLAPTEQTPRSPTRYEEFTPLFSISPDGGRDRYDSTFLTPKEEHIVTTLWWGEATIVLPPSPAVSAILAGVLVPLAIILLIFLVAAAVIASRRAKRGEPLPSSKFADTGV